MSNKRRSRDGSQSSTHQLLMKALRFGRPCRPLGPRRHLPWRRPWRVCRVSTAGEGCCRLSSSTPARRCRRKPPGGRRCLSRPLRPRLGSLQFRRSGIPSPPHTHITLLVPGGSLQAGPTPPLLLRQLNPVQAAGRYAPPQSWQSLHSLDWPLGRRCTPAAGVPAHRSGGREGRCLWQGFCGASLGACGGSDHLWARERVGEARPVGPQPLPFPSADVFGIRCFRPGLVLSEVVAAPASNPLGGTVRARCGERARCASRRTPGVPSCPFCPFTTVSAAVVSLPRKLTPRKLNRAIADPRRVLSPRPQAEAPGRAGWKTVNYSPPGDSSPGRHPALRGTAGVTHMTRTSADMPRTHDTQGTSRFRRAPCA